MKKLIDKLETASKNISCKSPGRLPCADFVDRVIALLFPQTHHGISLERAEIEGELLSVRAELIAILDPLMAEKSASIAEDFLQNLDCIYDYLLLDANAMYEGDPAAKSVDEVLIAYPGFYAIACYRLANFFYRSDVELLPRVITEHAHRLTGIDIHPGATIGKNFCIDHGTGIVIGETTEIRDNVKIYQGVTLGGLSVKKELANTKRHPTIEDNVVIYAHATILGGKTIIGKDSIVGGNVWITESIPSKSRVYHKASLDIVNSRSES